MSSSVEAAKAVGKVASASAKYPPFRLPLPKRKHEAKRVRTADLRMRISLQTKPRDFKRMHLVVTTSRSSRDALPLEKLGEWDPEPKMRRILPNAETGVADLSYAGKQAVRFEKRIELSGEKIRWWLEEGGAVPTKSVVKLLEHCELLTPGAHPFVFSKPPRPATQARPSGHWPEYEAPSPARTPGAVLRGTTWVLPEGVVKSRWEGIEEETEKLAQEFVDSLAAERLAASAKAAEAAAEKTQAQAEKKLADALRWEETIEMYRSRVAEVQKERQAADLQAAAEKKEREVAQRLEQEKAASEQVKEEVAPPQETIEQAIEEKTVAKAEETNAPATPPPTPAPEDK